MSLLFNVDVEGGSFKLPPSMTNAQLHLHHHPSQQALCQRLIDHLSNEQVGLFSESVVLIQNRGMATWLRQQMAERSGLCMQTEFPLPHRFLKHALSLFPLKNRDHLFCLLYTSDAADE